MRAERLTGLLLGRDAETAVRESDDERREYLRRFYDVPEELPTHYDLVVNTDLLTPPRAVAIIVAAAKS
jgi:cytidylate kinase